jgi:DNA repair exonuclease SbcCD ATPase subunit
MGKRSRKKAQNREEREAGNGAGDAPDGEPPNAEAAPPQEDAPSARRGVERPPSVAKLLGEDPPEPEETERDGGVDKIPPGKRFADPRLREVIAYAEEADYLYHLFRWIVLKGQLPAPRDWMPREDMPHPDAVAEVFGSWQRFLDHAGIPDAALLKRLREYEEREKELEVGMRDVEREQQRAADLRRQLDVARRKREDAERERDEAAGRATRAERALTDAEARAARAEELLSERRTAADTAAAGTPASDGASEEWLAVHEAALGELEAVRRHREDLLRRVEELEAAAARDRQAIAELSAALGDKPPEAEEEAAAEEDPKSVLEAVRIAAGTTSSLVFTESAFESAADSPYRRPAEILDALRKLDAVAERYRAGQMGTSLGQAAQEAGLTWRAGVSELARTRWAKHYVVTHDGHNLDLGPHLALGSGSGAGLIARIYLHLADGNGDVPRGVYVGHVGRHLPDTTT